MIWFAFILAVLIGIVVGIITRSVKKAWTWGLIALSAGVLLSLLIVYSGIMGG